jgi:hypothetical protein
MSKTLSTNAMVAEVQRRVPIGIPAGTCLDRLNEAYRWICQQGSFVWMLNQGTVTITSPALPAGRSGTFTLPTDFDPGRPAYILYGGLEIPYKPYDVAQKHQTYNTTVGANQFSLWSFRTSFAAAPVTYSYIGQVFPEASYPLNGTTTTLTIIYHTTTASPLVTTTPPVYSYYPTPDAFDSFIVDMAESELRRTYGLAGFENLIQKAQGSLQMMLDAYRSTKPTMMGVMDQTRQTQESQAAKAE